MTIPEDLRYTKDHEWIKLLEDGSTALVGITDFAQSELGDIVFVELKSAGTKLKEHEVPSKPSPIFLHRLPVKYLK